MRSASPPVVIVGGGFAGLSCATALADAGVPVHVIEARPTLGGRANTFRDPATGERIDNGQHVLAGCYRETVRFLARIGTLSRLHWPSTLRVPMIDETGRRTELVLPPLPPPLDLAAALLAWEALGGADRWSLLGVARAIRTPASARPDETVRQWLERHRQSPRLCRLLWEPLAVAALNQSIDDAAAASFVAVTSRMFAAEPDAATLLLPAVPLDELYAAPAQRFLERRGAAVATGARAQIVFDGTGVAGVRTSRASIPARLVICAVPWFALTETLASPPDALAPIVAAAAAMESSPIVTVNLWFDGFCGDEAILGLPGRTFQWVFARRILIGSDQSHLSLVSSGADAIARMSNEQAIAVAIDELHRAVPAARVPVRHASVVRERRATFSLRPGAPPRPSTITRVPGLLLAGDWIDTGLPATIESAVESGHRAARCVLQRLNP